MKVEKKSYLRFFMKNGCIKYLKMSKAGKAPVKKTHLRAYFTKKFLFVDSFVRGPFQSIMENFGINDTEFKPQLSL